MHRSFLPRRVRRSLPPACVLVALAVFVPACAPATTSPLAGPVPDEERIAISGRADGVVEGRMRRDDFVGIAEIPVSRTEAWRVLPEVWQELGLPEPTVDRRTFALAVTNHALQRRLGQTNLSHYLDCGSGITGNNADTHRIRLTVQALLERLSDSSTRIHTRVDATAHSTGGASSPPLPCSSRGTLEAQITRLLRERVR